MTEKKVKQKIGKENWQDFVAWMSNQTVGIYDDGTTDFYECDVNAFIEKLKTGHDRQDSPAWD